MGRGDNPCSAEGYFGRINDFKLLDSCLIDCRKMDFDFREAFSHEHPPGAKVPPIVLLGSL